MLKNIRPTTRLEEVSKKEIVFLFQFHPSGYTLTDDGVDFFEAARRDDIKTLRFLLDRRDYDINMADEVTPDSNLLGVNILCRMETPF